MFCRTFRGCIVVSGERNSSPKRRFLVATPLKVFYFTPLFHHPTEARLLARVLALVYAPRLPRQEQVLRPDPLVGAELTHVAEDPFVYVGVLAVLRRGVLDRL